MWYCKTERQSADVKLFCVKIYSWIASRPLYPLHDVCRYVDVRIVKLAVHSWIYFSFFVHRSHYIRTHVHQKMWSPRFSPDYRTRVSSLPYACTVISIITVILCQYAYTIIDAFLNKSIGKWFEKKRQREKISWTIAESDSKMHGIGNVEAAISQNVNEDETTTTIRMWWWRWGW